MSSQTGNSRDSDWYKKGPPELTEPTRELLESYSKIPSDKVVEHCAEFRDRAWDVHPYPCIGSYRFLELSISRLPVYNELLERLKTTDAIFLDLGCCFGQDIRRMIVDGAPAEKLYGSDLKQEFLDMGYDLFLDEDTCKVKFISADVFDSDSDLKQLDGKVDMLMASAFFHLFNLEDQKKVARRVVKLLKPQKGSFLCGRHVGSVQPGSWKRLTDNTSSAFRHNVETWEAFWKEIGEETGTNWDVNVILEDPPASIMKAQVVPRDFKWHVYTIRRL